jgi:hypothetical protein
VEVQMPAPPAPLLQITVRPGSAPRPVAADTGR